MWRPFIWSPPLAPNSMRTLCRVVFSLLTAFAALVSFEHAVASDWVVDLESRATIVGKGLEERFEPGDLRAVERLRTALFLVHESGRPIESSIEIPVETPPTRNRKATDAPTTEHVPVTELLERIFNAPNDAEAEKLLALLGETEMLQAARERAVKELCPQGDGKTDVAIVLGILERIASEDPQLLVWDSLSPKRFAQLRRARDTTEALEGAIKIALTGRNGKGWYAFMLFENPRANGTLRRLLAVTTTHETERSAYEAARRMLSDAFRRYETMRIWAAGDVVGSFPVYKGREPEVYARVVSDLYVTTERSLIESGFWSARFVRPAPLTAPFDEGLPLGRIEVLINGNIVGTSPIEASKGVGRGGFFTRVSDALKLALDFEPTQEHSAQ